MCVGAHYYVAGSILFWIIVDVWLSPSCHARECRPQRPPRQPVLFCRRLLLSRGPLIWTNFPAVLLKRQPPSWVPGRRSRYCVTDLRDDLSLHLFVRRRTHRRLAASSRITVHRSRALEPRLLRRT